MMLLFQKNSYTKLIIVTDNAGWALDSEALGVKRIAEKIGIMSEIVTSGLKSHRQCVHYVDKSLFLKEIEKQRTNRISLDYFHGDHTKNSGFLQHYVALKENHDKVSKVRVSCKKMEEYILTTGISDDKIHRIPIAINGDIVSKLDEISKESIREQNDIPKNSFVIGSFQKDGNGWKDGMDPKLIKGPDIFLKTIDVLKKRIPNIFVLLTGPSRGFVKDGLSRMSVPFKHINCRKFEEILLLYKALDVYIIASREEGGPKAFLECLASGVPLVSTDVGQVSDLGIHGYNALISRDVENYEMLADFACEIYHDMSLRRKMTQNGRKMALANSWDSQIRMWENFFDNYIER